MADKRYNPASYEALQQWKASGEQSRTPMLDMREAEREARQRNGGTLPTPSDPVGTPEVRKDIRERSGWSVQEVSAATGVPAGTIERYENGTADPATSPLAAGYRKWVRSVAQAIDHGAQSFDVVPDYVDYNNVDTPVGFDPMRHPGAGY
jgi:DNA-binding transcriptional regulator YiaG